MLGDLFYSAIFNPLYNALVFLVSVVPYADVGIALIILTIIVKIILLPLSIKATKTQLSLRILEPELNALKEKYKNNREEFARRMLELYRAHGINPFSSVLLLFIQLPIIFGLYWVFARGGLPELNTDLLYAFTPIPETFNMQFLWIDNIAEASAVFALLAGITQFFQIRFTLPPLQARGKEPSLKDDLMRSFHLQMRYVLPVIVVIVAYVISSAIALYWTTSNLFAIAQELLIRRRIQARFDAKQKEKKDLPLKDARITPQHAD